MGHIKRSVQLQPSFFCLRVRMRKGEIKGWLEYYRRDQCGIPVGLWCVCVTYGVVQVWACVVTPAAAGRRRATQRCVAAVRSHWSHPTTTS